MFTRLRHLLEMIRFSHTVFALPFALLAAVMAWTTPMPRGAHGVGLDTIGFQWRHLAGVLICMVGARSAAMAFNRIVDRDVDAVNPRTAGRHLPAGILSLTSVRWFTVISSVVFLLGAALFWPNWLPLALALPVLFFLFGYSYAKRFTSWAHVWLGAALMLAPICAWIAVRGMVVAAYPLDLLAPMLLGLAVLFWVSGFDMIYACQDADFDSQARLKSVPATWGIPIALRLAACFHAAMLVVLATLPFVGNLGGPPLTLHWPYWTSIVAVACLLIYEHALVRPDDLTRVNVAFFHVNSIVSLGLFLVGTLDLVLW